MNFGFLRGNVTTGGGTPESSVGPAVAGTGNLKVADWLYRSKAASVIWLAAGWRGTDRVLGVSRTRGLAGQLSHPQR